MRIAVEGCAHGELNKIYECVEYIQMTEEVSVDLLICCGDFQCCRDEVDLDSMSAPRKYKEMKDFHEYYSGEKTAPVLTVFIGGNHEASNYLWELPYGGWVSENIFYLGFSGVVEFGGIRICGMSGIYNRHDYFKDHFEALPLNEDSKKSFYHVRKTDIEKLKLLAECPPDIVLSHDWPTNIYKYGDREVLALQNPNFRVEVENNSLTGNDGAEEILKHIQPKYWFSGHMHTKFAAIVEHPTGKKTKFLALDKCLPQRQFLQILDLETNTENVLRYDPYWLGILKMTSGKTKYKEAAGSCEIDKKILVDIEKDQTNLEVIPFMKSVDGCNLQTSMFCERFNLINPCAR